MSEPASDGITYCAECEYVFRVSRNDPPWRWLCVQHRRRDATTFVSRHELTQAPYANCYRVNYGACPLYAPARVRPEDDPHDPSESEVPHV